MRNLFNLFANSFSTLLAIASLAISFNTVYIQERRELRSELTDILGEVVDLMNTRLEIGTTNYAGNTGEILIGNNSQQIGILLQRANLITEQIPDLILANDYLTIAYAYNLRSDIANTEKNYLSGIEAAQIPMEFIGVYEGYAQFLYKYGRLDSARENYQLAADYGQAVVDAYGGISELGYLYQRWALNESYYGEIAETPALLTAACRAYSQIENIQIRQSYYNGLLGAWYNSTGNNPDALRLNSCDELLEEA